MSEMVSFGAGVNSVAMTIMLVEEGWRGSIVFADPGAEHPDTYCYIGMFEREWLKPRGLGVTVISPVTTPDLYPKRARVMLLEYCREKSVTPIMFSRWCTGDWKRQPLTKWAKTHRVETQYIGIAYEERQRARFTEQFGINVEYPLVNRKINREQCKQIIREAGLSVPPKSGCWFCPFQRTAEWRALYDLRPDLFWEAVAMEDAAYERTQRHDALNLGISLGMRLSEAGRMWDAQMELPLMPEREYEHAMMCECRL